MKMISITDGRKRLWSNGRNVLTLRLFRTLYSDYALYLSGILVGYALDADEGRQVLASFDAAEPRVLIVPMVLLVPLLAAWRIIITDAACEQIITVCGRPMLIAVNRTSGATMYVWHTDTEVIEVVLAHDHQVQASSCILGALLVGA